MTESNGAAPPTPGERFPLAARLGYPVIAEVSPSPDGQRVVYSVREPLLTDEKSEFVTQLYVAGPDRGEPIQLTYGDGSANSAAWSPDGSYLAFLSKRGSHGAGKRNIYVMRLDGGEAWPLTGYEKTDVASVHWSPDGTRLAFRMPEPPTEEKEKQRKARDDARQYGIDYDFTHLYVLPFTVGARKLPEVRQITRGRLHVVDFDWSPDGAAIAFTHQPNPDADCWLETRLAIIASDGTAEQPTDLGPVFAGGAHLRFSPDGRWIACKTGEEPAHWAFAAKVGLHPVPTSGGEPTRARRLLAATPDEEPSVLGWAPDGQAVYILEQHGTASRFLSLPVDGSPAQPLVAADLYRQPATANQQGQIAFVGQDFHQPQAVYLFDPGTGESRKVASPAFPADWPQGDLPRAEVINWPAPDGLRIEGVVIYPQGYQAGKRYPLILHVHGGPAGVFTRSFLGAPGGQADILGLTDSGYAILRVNPRGSGGYGRAFRFANSADWGGGDYQDIMAGVDHLIALGLADPERLGVGGWSYGGFMTSWIITQTRRFRAACIGAPVTDPISFNGTSDIPGFIPDYFGSEFWDDPSPYLRQSPLLHVKGVTTPALIQHGADDVRVPLGQGREFHSALKRQGVPTELVIYPRQGHAISEPRLMLDVARRASAWFARWIPAGPC